MFSTRYSRQFVKKLEISRRTFEKASNIQIHENPFSESRAVACGWTEGHEKNVTFRNFVNAPKNTLYGQTIEFLKN
jgi:hypothetical protein